CQTAPTPATNRRRAPTRSPSWRVCGRAGRSTWWCRRRRGGGCGTTSRSTAPCAPTAPWWSTRPAPGRSSPCARADVVTKDAAEPYEVLVGRVREAVAHVVPEGATVAVATRGDEDLLELGERRGWHFPQLD